MNSRFAPLSVIVPAFNEEHRLPPTLRSMIEYLTPRCETLEIIVVDDGSTDKTAEVVRSFGAPVKLAQLDQNQGKGAAVRRGMLEAEGELLLYADADGATPIAEFDRLHAEIARGAGIAFGSRAKNSSSTNVTTVLHRKLMGRIFNACVNLFAIGGVLDTQCGFKLFTRQAAKFIFERQTATGFSFDVEILVIARRAGIVMEEVPVTWHNIPGSKVNLVADSARMFFETTSFAWKHRSITPKSYSSRHGAAEE